MTPSGGVPPRIGRLQRMALLSVAAALVTMALKFWAWSFTGSVGLLSDAMESLVNLAAASFAFFVLGVAARPPDAGHHFGHDKAEYFSVLAEGLLILLAAGAIAVTAWGRLQTPEPLAHVSLGLAISLLASACNALVAWKLLRVASEEGSLALRADAHHLLSDVWTSLAIVAGLGVVWWLPGQPWLDPLIALVVAAHLVVTGLRVLSPALAGLMDAALPEHELAALRAVLARELPADAEVTGLRTRKAGRRRFVDANVLVPGDCSVARAHALCDRLEAAMRDTLPGCDIRLHVAPLAERARHD